MYICPAGDIGSLLILQVYVFLSLVFFPVFLCLHLTPLVFTSTSEATAWGEADGPASAGGRTGEDVVPRTLASPLVSRNHEDEVVVLVALSAEC